MSTPRDPDHPEVLPPKLEEVSDGIFAYLQLHGQWGLNNAGFFVGEDAVTVVDTCFTVPRAKVFLETIRDVTDLSLRTLVNTHHHGDHTYGNFLLPTATIIGHELCRQEMITTGLSTINLFAEGTEWGDIEIAPPFVTFDERLNVYVDDLKVEAHFLGPAHTRTDVVYYVPDRKLMFTGDLVFHGGTPFVLMGSVQGSLAAYERLRDFDIETVVPGHGEITDASVFDDMVDYLTWLWDLAEDAFASDTEPLEAARQAELGRFAEWHDSERLVGNLHRAYSELRGEPHGTQLELQPIVADMVAYNDGEPLRCLA